MKNETLTLTVSDGTSMNAYVARPVAAPAAGVIVFQEAFGVNDYIKDTAQKLAAEGYLAIAPELFHRSAPGYAKQNAPLEEVMPFIEALRADEIDADAKATFDWLKAEGVERIGIIGFCMGGRSAFIANASLPLDAMISFYGGGIAEGLLDRVPSLSAPMLFFWGGADVRIPRETWNRIPAALDEAGKEHVQVEMSGAAHAYMTYDRPSFHKAAAELSWPLVTAFFRQKLLS